MAEKIGAWGLLVALVAGLVGWAADTWVWLPMFVIGWLVAFGLVKFGWDASGAVENKAKEGRRDQEG